MLACLPACSPALLQSSPSSRLDFVYSEKGPEAPSQLSALPQLRGEGGPERASQASPMPLRVAGDCPPSPRPLGVGGRQVAGWASRMFSPRSFTNGASLATSRLLSRSIDAASLARAEPLRRMRP
mmetsp:Transcript_21465/g.64404  ORF Transcript_21465/g.64404 Transcript_21465/m.64404 type:complete len:125 (-) Transcript_21465:1912-2286(-)